MTTLGQEGAPGIRFAALAIALLGGCGIAAAIGSAADAVTSEALPRALPALLVIAGAAGLARGRPTSLIAGSLTTIVGALWSMLAPVHDVVVAAGIGVAEWFVLFFAPGALVIVLSVRALDALSEPASASRTAEHGCREAVGDLRRALRTGDECHEPLDWGADSRRSVGEREHMPHVWVVERGRIVLYDRGRGYREAVASFSTRNGSTNRPDPPA